MKGSKIIYNKYTTVLLATIPICIHELGQNSSVTSLQTEGERGVRIERTERVTLGCRSLDTDFADRLIMSLITHYEHRHAHNITYVNKFYIYICKYMCMLCVCIQVYISIYTQRYTHILSYHTINIKNKIYITF